MLLRFLYFHGKVLADASNGSANAAWKLRRPGQDLSHGRQERQEKLGGSDVRKVNSSNYR